MSSVFLVVGAGKFARIFFSCNYAAKRIEERKIESLREVWGGCEWGIGKKRKITCGTKKT